MKKILCTILFCSALHAGAQQQAGAGAKAKAVRANVSGKSTGAATLHRAQKALTRVIVHDIFSPPVASRIYLYSNAAAYEALVPSQEKYRSLRHSIPAFPVIRDSGTVDYELAALIAFMSTASNFVFSESILKDSLDVMLTGFRKLPEAVYASSLRYGQRVADSVIRWAGGDNYKQTRRFRRYVLSKEDGKWLPTPPGYMAAVEPYWGQMRTVALDSAAECLPAPALKYGVGEEDEFFRQAKEVYDTGRQLSTLQRNIALFWDCNPFFLNTQGHLNFATKKLSPGGHWISIAAIASVKKNYGLIESAAVYFLTSAALYDAFIGCWLEKYRSNVIRPETFINARIDETWRPLLQTPPFPEYPSGHSVISASAAVVLTSIFGEGFGFDDTTETDYGLPVRSFGSFDDAANEAGISRFYGGIHYRAAVENGLVQGRMIGQKILSRIRLK